MKRHSRTDPRRSKRILAWALAGFVAIQFVAGVLFDYAWTGIRFPHLREMLVRLEAEPRSPDVIVMGSSRSQTSIDPTELTHELRAGLGDPNFRVFNAVVPSSDGIAMELELNRILDAGHRPKLLLIEMTPATISRATTWYVTHLFRQVPWHEVPAHFWEVVLSGNIGRLAQARTVPLYRHRYEVLKSLRRETGFFAPVTEKYVSPADIPRAPFSEEQWLARLHPAEPDPAATERAGRGLQEVRKEIRFFGDKGNALDSLDRMLTRCRELNIRVVLVGVPVSSAYRGVIAPIGDEYHRILRQREQEYGVTFWDEHDAIPDHDFADYHHVTREGGLTFSRYLARKHLVPTLRDAPK